MSRWLGKEMGTTRCAVLYLSELLLFPGCNISEAAVLIRLPGLKVLRDPDSQLLHADVWDQEFWPRWILCQPRMLPSFPGCQLSVKRMWCWGGASEHATFVSIFSFCMLLLLGGEILVQISSSSNSRGASLLTSMGFSRVHTFSSGWKKHCQICINHYQSQNFNLLCNNMQ